MKDKGSANSTIIAIIGILLLLLVSAGLYRFMKHFSSASKHATVPTTAYKTQHVKITPSATSSTSLDQDEATIQKDLDGVDSSLNDVTTSASNQSLDTPQ